MGVFTGRISMDSIPYAVFTHENRQEKVSRAPWWCSSTIWTDVSRLYRQPGGDPTCGRVVIQGGGWAAQG